jgi:hypothetical protein
MKLLPNEVKIKFFRFLSNEEPIGEFEQWVYATNTLEESLGNEDYFNLISLDFSKRGSRYELIKILERHIDLGEYETWKLRNLLSLFLSQKGDLPMILCEFYELYCNGFYFLDTLGLGYGLAITVPSSSYSSESWQELADEEKEELLSSILPDALKEAQKVLTWLNEGKIIITNKQDELGHYLYLDKRTEETKDPIKSESWWKFW